MMQNKIISRLKREVPTGASFQCRENTLEFYHCKYCNHHFDTMIHFKNHNKKKLEGACTANYDITSYICRNCSFETYSFLLWFKHEINGRCALKNSVKSNLNSGNTLLQCEKYPYKTEHNYMLKRHIIAQHSDNKGSKYIKCEKCQYLTPNKHTLERHMALRHNITYEINAKCENTLLECEKCSYKTKHKSNFARHVIAQHSDDKGSKYIECEKCGYVTPNKYTLEGHMAVRCNITHEINAKCENTLLQCENCLYKAGYKYMPERHIITQHPGDKCSKYITCAKCGYVTPNKHTLERHMAVKHNIKLKINAKYVLKNMLKSNVNDENTSLQREMYSYNAGGKHTFTSHVNVKHTDDKVSKYIRCERCTYVTPNKDTFDRHMATKHSYNRDKWFKCKNCTYMVVEGAALKRHVSEKHTNKDKWFKCEHCDYKTPRRGALPLHVASHRKFNGFNGPTPTTRGE